jgi:hypothetical protein
MKQMKDTPSIACAICEQLNFSKNSKSFTHDLQAEYLRLIAQDKPFSSAKVFFHANDRLKMENCHGLQPLTE